MININLLPYRKLKTQKEQKHFVFMILGVLISAVVIVLLLNGYFQYRLSLEQKSLGKLNDMVSQIDRELMQHKANKNQYKMLLKRIDLIKTLKLSQKMASETLSTIGKKLASDIYLTELSFKNNQLQLRGVSEHRQSVSALMRTIEKQTLFGEVYLGEISHQSFMLQANVLQGAPDEH